MIKRLIAAALAALWALPAPVLAQADAGPKPLSFTCPLTGTPFKQVVAYSTFPLVTFSDGSYPGDENIDQQVPVCPDDGLVILADFTPQAPQGGEDEAPQSALAYLPYGKDDLARLPALIADPAYAALKAEGRYAQAYWIATQLGRPAFHRFSMLQRASWAAVDPALRRKRVAQLVAEGPALIEASDRPEPDKAFHRFYIVNGLRELGRFDEALALIAEIEARGSRVPAQEDPDSIYGPGEIAGPMRAVIAARDRDRYPVGLMPGKWANAVCNGQEMRAPYTPTETTKAACARRKSEQAREREESEAAFVELDRLRENPKERDRLCASTPEDKRSKGLQMACETAEDARNQKAASAMVQDGEKVAVLCETTRADALKGADFYACNSYGVVFDNALGRLITDDDDAFAILCPEGDTEEAEISDRDHRVSSGCVMAQNNRRERRIEAILFDRAKSDALCTGTPETQWDGDTYAVCSGWRSLRETESIERLAADATAFEMQCRRYAKTNSAGNAVRLEEGLQQNCNRAYRLRENTKFRVAAEARGLRCFPTSDHGPERPHCVPEAQYDEAMRPATSPADLSSLEMALLEESSLSQAARIRAAALIAQAKRDKTYPKKRPGDRY